MNQTQDQLVVETVEVADSFWSRLKGWMFKKRVSTDAGVYITPCQSVHTWGMRFSIRAIYINSEGSVLNNITLKPWRMGPWQHQSRGVLELPLSNKIGEQCQPGDQLNQINGNGW